MVLGAAGLLAGCSTGGSGAWTHAGLSDTQRQERMLECQRQSAEVEARYVEDNSRGGVNTTTPLINNLKVRQRALALRNESYEQCLREAGFTQQ